MPKKRKTFYAVARGRKVGVFLKWEECEQQVKGFPGAQFKGFDALSEAEHFLSSGSGEGIRMSARQEGDQTSLAMRRIGFAREGSTTVIEPSGTKASPVGTNEASPAPFVNPYSNGRRSIMNPYRSSNKTAAMPSPTTPVSTQNLTAGFVNPYLRSASKVSPNTNLCQQDDESDNLRMYINDSFDIFFATLLRSSVKDYVEAAKSDYASETLWKTLCDRVNISMPVQCIQPVYDNPKDHFDIRAALVLEEARDSISKSLAHRWLPPNTNRDLNQATTNTRKSKALHVYLKDSESRAHGMIVLTFQALKRVNNASNKPNFLTAEQKENLRYGVIFECMAENQRNGIEGSILGCVLQTTPERIHIQGNFDVLIFRPLAIESGLSWKLIPIDNFISPFRQFVALTEYAARVPFIDSLLGKAVVSARKEVIASGLVTTSVTTPLDEKPAFTFQVPSLNDTQENAVSRFLSSSPNSITLIQGPPGTGKTTLLVATICRWLLRKDSDSDRRRSIAVCCPTNRAVSVLATRFVKASEGSDVNIALVGDCDKLLGTEVKSASPLRPYFVYNWKEMIEEEFDSIQKSLTPGRKASTREEAKRKANSLRNMLFRRLLELPSEFKTKLEKFCDAFDDHAIDGQTEHKYAIDVYKAFLALAPDAVLYDLLRSANVIFSTLCTSGTNLLRKVPSVEALIIDEAAAASEPDICIPFHWQPSRLLVVGDPKQLPSTILSDRARKFGLDLSLHERLMNRCGANFVMLDVQYRMHPEISVFPSSRFYGDKLVNGQNVTAPEFRKGPLLLNGQPYLFLQVDEGKEEMSAGSMCNHHEADVVTNLASKLVDRSNPDRLRIITFYSAQVQLLRTKLAACGMKDVLVATVDSSQGCEADIVIVSFVRTESSGFLTDDRRLCVALTRARYQIVCVGKINRFPFFHRGLTLRELATNAQVRHVVAPFQSVQGRNTSTRSALVLESATKKKARTEASAL